MLNELKEVEAYLSKPDADESRLGAKLLSDNFKGECKLNGLADILTLVVCHYLYDFNSVKKINENLKEKAILIMRIWCGFENDVTSDELEKSKADNEQWFKTYPQAVGWLKEYHSKHLAAKSSDWSTYSIRWKNSLNSKSLYQAERICYENIVAQAVARGPLKEYKLIINKNYEDVIKNGVKNEKGKKPDARRQKTMLKLLAAYKVLQLQHPDQKYVLLQTNRVLNWLGYESDKEDRWCLEFKWCGESIFLMERYPDFKKFGINQEFLKKIDVRLQDSVADSRLEGYYIYQDSGHGKDNALIKL